MSQEYFGIGLWDGVQIALPLTNIGTIDRFDPKKICPIPGMAPFWLGIANQKGARVWVFDGDKFLGLESKRDDRLESGVTTVMFARREGDSKRRVAWRVKDLLGVLTLNSNQAAFWPDNLSSKFQKLFTAVAIYDNRPILILDSQAFFQAIRF